MLVRIPYDSLALRAVAGELRSSLLGGQVQHIAQPAPTDLVLTLRSHGASHMLLLSCDAAHARIHLTHARRPNPPTPPPFCMMCRKHLEGARVTAVEQRGFDRVLDIGLAAHDGARLRLVAELMGKHSNLILLAGTDTVLDAAKRISRRLSRFREVLPGSPYAPPPAQEGKADPFAVTPEEVAALTDGLSPDPEAYAARLMARYAGLSPFLAAEIAQRARRASVADAWEAIFGAAKAGAWSPVLVRGERAEPVGAYPFPTVQFPADAQHPRDTLNTALDHYYSIALPRAARDAAAHELAAALERALKGREKQREQLQRAAQEAGRAEEYRQAGDLLLANLHAVPKEAASVTVADYYAPDAPPRVIALDPALSPRENAEAWFRRYRKAKDGAPAAEARIEHVGAEIEALSGARERLAQATDLEAVRSLREELAGTNLLRFEQAAGKAGLGNRPPDFEGKKIRVVHTPEGYDILVGENSEANDYLTGRVAAPGDLWLHVRANTSAHVVIRTAGRPEAVPPAVLQQAAGLCARHSAAKHSSLVPVDYTLKKYVRRPRGAAPGAALYQHEKTLYVSPKEE